MVRRSLAVDRCSRNQRGSECGECDNSGERDAVKLPVNLNAKTLVVGYWSLVVDHLGSSFFNDQ